jgi:hypothetical protein
VAFSPPERTKLLFYLGYSIFEDSGDVMRAINSLDSKEELAGPIIRDLLLKLEDIDREIHETMTLAAAVEDGSIKVRAHYTLDHLRRMGRGYVHRLARFLKVQIDGDVFGSGSDVSLSRDPSEPRRTH